MAKRCPPGVICFEHVTIIFLIIFTLGIVFYMSKPQTSKIVIQETAMPAPRLNLGTNIPNDVLRNPYDAPLKNNGFFMPPSIDVRGAIPINVSTQGPQSSYEQVGILTRKNTGNDETILPLMGSKLMANRDKWNYYTMNDKNNMIKLPVSYKGKSCTNEYGCEDLSNGDGVYVQGYNDTFNVTLYDNQAPRYIPYI